MFVGKTLTLKQDKTICVVTVTKMIANMPASRLYLAKDDFGIFYLFEVYEGLHTIYSIGKYDDGLWGTKTCEIKVKFKDRIKGWFKV